MSKIKILNQNTINAIAAGEIIENPSAVIKELIENSIDAKAKHISIEIKRAGKDFIRVTDDGEGMTLDDISLAFRPHATSKLSKIEDLLQIETMGFRGEALPSIAAVAKVVCISKTENDKLGKKVTIEHGDIVNIEEIGCQTGTTIIVYNLFDYIPVRKKFLKSDHYENNLITDLVNRFALSHRFISFTLQRDHRIVLKTNKKQSLNDLIYSVLGYDIIDSLWHTTIKNDDIEIHGYFSNNLLYRSNRTHQYIFINHRIVSFPELTKSIEDAYKSLIPLRRYPIFILWIKLPPQWVDVNVHPNKLKVLIENNDNLIDMIVKTIEKKLYNRSEIPKFKSRNDKIIDESTIFDVDWEKQKDNSGEFFIEDKNESVTSSNIREDPIEVNLEEMISENSVTFVDHTLSKLTNWEESSDLSINHLPKFSSNPINKYDVFPKGATNDTGEVSGKSFNELKFSSFVGSLFKTYLLFQYGDSFYILDQHAVHERIKFEYYLNKYTQDNIHRQALLNPIVLKTNSSLNSKTEKTLLKLGYKVESFDESSVVIREVPIIMGETITEYIAVDIVTEVLDKNLDSDDLALQLPINDIMQKSCKSAVKAGDNIYEREAIDLVNQLLACEQPLTCPHGRPTIVKFQKKELEKMFLREMS